MTTETQKKVWGIIGEAWKQTYWPSPDALSAWQMSNPATVQNMIVPKTAPKVLGPNQRAYCDAMGWRPDNPRPTQFVINSMKVRP